MHKQQLMNIKNIISRVIISCLMIISIWGISIYIDHIRLFRLKNIQITGNTHISNEEIIANLSLQKDESLFSIDVSQLQSRLERMKYLQGSMISRIFPSTLKVSSTRGVPSNGFESSGTGRANSQMSKPGLFPFCASSVTTLHVSRYVQSSPRTITTKA